jgi:hypothetical protein
MVRPRLHEIVQVDPIKIGEEKKFEILYKTENGLERSIMEKVGNSPRFLITFQKQPVATASQFYTLLSHEEVEAVISKELKLAGYDDTDLVRTQPRPWQRIWSVKLKTFDLNEHDHMTSKKVPWKLGFSATNSYDLSLGLNSNGYAFRTVCTNGLVLGEKLFGRTLKHINADNDPELLKGMMGENLRWTIENVDNIAGVVEDFNAHDTSPDQVTQIGQKLGIRKYESKILANSGILYEYEFKGPDIKTVKFTRGVKTELNVLNAFTSLANGVNTSSRSYEIQSKIADMITSTRI